VVLLISSAVDLVGVDDIFHGRRVAMIAIECAKRLNWDQATLNLLFDAGLLHDAGVSSTRIHRTLVNELDWEEADLHCERGYSLFKDFNPLANLAPLIRYHHSHWEDLQKQDIDSATAILSNLIYLADRIDASSAPYYSDNSLLLHVQEIRSLINRFRGNFFAPELVEAFLDISQAEAFWLILSPEFIPQYVSDFMQSGEKQPIDLDDLKMFALIMAEIVDAKSHFTTEHSLGVARLSRYIAEHFGISGIRLDTLEVAALLHDIGKLQIPDEVLESPLRLTPQERAIMTKHSFATYQILKRVSGFEDLAIWASVHHESLNGTGYPFHMQARELSIEARIIKVADIYQAFAQNRPFRKALPANEVLVKLQNFQLDNEVDPMLVNFVAQNLESCHRAAVGPANETGLM